MKDIEARQAQLEHASLAMVAKTDGLYNMNLDMEEVDSEYQNNIEAVVSSLWSLSDEIMFKYASGFVNELPDKMSQMVGYPEWWLKAVGYSEGPPPPPTKPKCCLLDRNPGDSFLRKHEIVAPLTGKAAMKHYLEMQNQVKVKQTSLTQAEISIML
jgi:hypothetical protein